MVMDDQTLIAAGQRVIAIEGEALTRLGRALDTPFAQAARLILSASGKVVVSGIGKSGHIARKIAGTLSSTGTPSHFVHPAEASHGDLGTMAKGDVLIVISNSGETEELANIIAYSRRFAIPLIAITSRAGSTLDSQADVTLLLPEAEEACETGVVPTTSTTMTLALGDALAIALMKHRDFTPDQFRLFHPGGRLGARLLTVDELMHSEFPLVEPDCSMPEALIVMTRSGYGTVGVGRAGGRLEGIITDGDLRRHMDGLLGMTASEVMTKNPRSIAPDALAESAVALMNDKNITSLFVVEDGKPVGFLNIHDCLRAGIV
jgi:arabinose-5-phosphate isomerase